MTYIDINSIFNNSDSLDANNNLSLNEIVKNVNLNLDYNFLYNYPLIVYLLVFLSLFFSPSLLM